jgi:hypothetical protein
MQTNRLQTDDPVEIARVGGALRDHTDFPERNVNTNARRDLTGTRRSRPRLSYAARHWEGDSSLGVGYLLNWLFATVAICLAFLCVWLPIALDEHP